MLSWFFRYVSIGLWLRRIVHAKIVGADNLPARGAYVLAMGSHKTELESGIVSAWLPRRKIHFYAKAEYWERGKPLAWFMKTVGQIPMKRGDAKEAEKAIDAGAELLRSGEVLAVYPEGTRSPDEFVHKGYTGFVRTVIRAGGDVPIIPVGLVGMESVSPSGSGFVPRRGNVVIVIGEPIYLTKAEKLLAKSERFGQAQVARIVTDRVMRKIAELSGKQYSNEHLVVPQH